MSYKTKIISLLEARNNWVPGYELEKVDSPLGWIGSSGIVRARELEREGLIEKRYNNGFVEYRIPQEEYEQMSIL